MVICFVDVCKCYNVVEGMLLEICDLKVGHASPLPCPITLTISPPDP